MFNLKASGIRQEIVGDDGNALSSDLFPGALGRPSRMSPRLAARLVEAAAAGYSDAQSAEAVGINRSTFYRWRKRSSQELHRIELTSSDIEGSIWQSVFGECVDVDLAPVEIGEDSIVWRTKPPVPIRTSEWPYVLLLFLFDRARGAFLAECVSVVRRAAKSNWHAAAWLLERSNPRDWSRRKPVQMRIDGQGTLADISGHRVRDILDRVEQIRLLEERRITTTAPVSGRFRQFCNE